MPRIIGVISGKGGVGKTTTAINLGAALSSKYSKSVAVVDCNITTPHVGLSLGILHESFSTLNDVLKGKKDIIDVIHPFSVGLSIVPASLALNDLKGVNITRLRSSLRKTLEEFDIVLLDAAPGLGREAVSAILASDEVLFVTTPYTVAISDVLRTKKVVNEAGKEMIGIIVNMRHNKDYELTTKEIESFAQIPVIGTINYDQGVLKSLAIKTPVVISDSRSKTSQEFFKIAARLAGEQYSVTPRFLDKIMNIFRRQPE
jgi:septum site-determining protein MinD